MTQINLTGMKFSKLTLKTAFVLLMMSVAIWSRAEADGVKATLIGLIAICVLANVRLRHKSAAALFLPLLLSVPSVAADKPFSMNEAANDPVDTQIVDRIRDEGMRHSHVMEYASGLLDGVGSRLTGSFDFGRAEEWSMLQLRKMGASNVHAESWSDFGMGWQHLGTNLELTAPGTATFLAQATPWSPATAGEQSAPVIAIPAFHDEMEFEKWKGKLAGKIILYGRAPKIKPDFDSPIEHYDQTKLDHFKSYPLDGDQSDSYVLNPDAAFWEGIFKERALLEKVGEFFANESAVAVLRAGGSSGILHDDTGYSLGWFVYRPEHRQAIPSAVIADEAFDRMSRLLTHSVPVTVRLNVESLFTGDHQPGINVIAEIPGTDRTLKDQIVMLGGHLDSWTAGTGATDDGAGVIIGLEAIRILRALDIHPRRTIRLALWGGEEQGSLGSEAYVKEHFGERSYSMKPDEQTMPNFVRQQIGPISVRADYAALDAYFNTDNGTGKFLGIFTEGNTAVANVFQRWLPLVQDLGFTTISLRNSGATDHTSFERIGLDGFQFLQDPRDYDSRTGHTNLDTYEHLSEVDLKQAAVVMAIFVFNTAQRDAMLPRKPMPHPEQNKQRDMPLEGIYPRLAP